MEVASPAACDPISIVAAAKVVWLKPDTAYLETRVRRTTPCRRGRRSFDVRGGGQPHCVECIGKPNNIMKL